MADGYGGYSSGGAVNIYDPFETAVQGWRTGVGIVRDIQNTIDLVRKREEEQAVRDRMAKHAELEQELADTEAVRKKRIRQLERAKAEGREYDAAQLSELQAESDDYSKGVFQRYMQQGNDLILMGTEAGEKAGRAMTEHAMKSMETLLNQAASDEAAMARQQSVNETSLKREQMSQEGADRRTRMDNEARKEAAALKEGGLLEGKDYLEATKYLDKQAGIINNPESTEDQKMQAKTIIDLLLPKMGLKPEDVVDRGEPPEDPSASEGESKTFTSSEGGLWAQRALNTEAELGRLRKQRDTYLARANEGDSEAAKNVQNLNKLITMREEQLQHARQSARESDEKWEAFERKAASFQIDYQARKASGEFTPKGGQQGRMY